MYFDRKKVEFWQITGVIHAGGRANGTWIYAESLLVGSVRGVNGICKLIFCVFFLCDLAACVQRHVHHPWKKYRAVDVFNDLLCLGRGAVFTFTSGDDFCRVVLRAKDRIAPGRNFAYRFFYLCVRHFDRPADRKSVV